MKTILLTGSTGFIGRYVYSYISKDVYEVICINRNSNYGCIQADLTDDEFIDRMYLQLKGKKVYAIVHLAADIRMDGDLNIWKTNFNGTWNLIKLANKLDVCKFIYVSSIPIIGKPINIPITEEHPINPCTLYHYSKYASEIKIRSELKNKINNVIVRIASPIGVGMNPNCFLSRMIDKCREDNSIEIYGKGTRIQNYIDVRDIARLINMLLDRDVTGTYLVPGKTSISNVELAYKCRELFDSSSRIGFAPVEDNSDNDRWIIDGSRLKSTLGFESEYSIEDTLLWIKNSGGEV